MSDQLTQQLLEILDRHRRGEIKIMAQVMVDVKITVSAAVEPLTVDASGVPATATVGSAYSGALKASGGAPPYSFALTSGALPDGLTLGTDGSISGTPGTAGNFDAEITVSDSAGNQAAAKVSHSV